MIDRVQSVIGQSHGDTESLSAAELSFCPDLDCRFHPFLVERGRLKEINTQTHAGFTDQPISSSFSHSSSSYTPPSLPLTLIIQKQRTPDNNNNKTKQKHIPIHYYNYNEFRTSPKLHHLLRTSSRPRQFPSRPRWY